jgi:hypothetical protein
LEQCLDALVVEPGAARFGDPTLEGAAERAVRGERRTSE